MAETQVRLPDTAAPTADEVDVVPTEARVERLTVIRPVSGWPSIDFPELWAYRELAATLAWRDFRVRYRQTAIGIGWAVLQPALMTLVFTVVFGKFANFPSEDLPYPVFTFSGILLWTYFASALTRSSACLVTNSAFITKVYFPRMLLPLSSVTSPVIDFVFASSVLVVLMAWFHVPPEATTLLAPLFLLLAGLTALGVGMWLAAINVRYRDVPYAIPFLLLMWMFLTPVFYSSRELPEHWQWLYSLNPMTGVIEGFRWAVVGTPAPSLAQLAVSLGVAAVLLVTGLAFFKRSEPSFADTI